MCGFTCNATAMGQCAHYSMAVCILMIVHASGGQCLELWDLGSGTSHLYGVGMGLDFDGISDGIEDFSCLVVEISIGVGLFSLLGSGYSSENCKLFWGDVNHEDVFFRYS